MRTFDPSKVGSVWMITGGTVFGGLPAGLITAGVALAYGAFIEGLFALFAGWLWGVIFSLVPAILGTVALQFWTASRGVASEYVVLLLGGVLGLLVVLLVLNGGTMIILMGLAGGVCGAFGAMHMRGWFASR